MPESSAAATRETALSAGAAGSSLPQPWISDGAGEETAVLSPEHSLDQGENKDLWTIA